ncbi:MAG: winged helix DNA-binding protein [Burkholderiaceae bacterium]
MPTNSCLFFAHYHCEDRFRLVDQNSTRKPSPESALLSDLEYTLYVVAHGFWRWQTHCAQAAGVRNLGALDIQVLHTVNHRARDKHLADICLVLNITERHTVTYCLRKLQAAGLVEYEQAGRDRTYRATASGDAFCARYRQVREEFLLRVLGRDGADFAAMESITSSLISLARSYEEAGRAVTIASSAKSIGLGTAQSPR